MNKENDHEEAQKLEVEDLSISELIRVRTAQVVASVKSGFQRGQLACSGYLE